MGGCLPFLLTAIYHPQNSTISLILGKTLELDVFCAFYVLKLSQAKHRRDGCTKLINNTKAQTITSHAKRLLVDSALVLYIVRCVHTCPYRKKCIRKVFFSLLLHSTIPRSQNRKTVFPEFK